MRMQLLATVAVGLLAAACQSSTNQNAAYRGSPYGSTAMSSEQACVDYGFPVGTNGYNLCVTRERAARASGRAPQDYAEARVTADARSACNSYGLDAGSDRYNRCVSREVDARVYRTSVSQSGAATYRTDQYGYRVDTEGYRVDANGYRLQQSSTPAPAYYPAPAPAPAYYPASGQQTYTDQYGYRVDAYGRRY